MLMPDGGLVQPENLIRSSAYNRWAARLEPCHGIGGAGDAGDGGIKLSAQCSLKQLVVHTVIAEVLPKPGALVDDIDLVREHSSLS